jgi:hypothetical protein
MSAVKKWQKERIGVKIGKNKLNACVGIAMFTFAN